MSGVDDPPNKFYFLHIPKTAGTSIRDWISESGRFNVCPDGLWSQLLSRDATELKDYSLFFGHFYRHLFRHVAFPLEILTFLRNPFDRALSHYHHVLRDGNHYFHERAVRQGSLLAFLKDPQTRSLVENFQVRSLSAIMDTSGFSGFLGGGQARFALEKHVETSFSGLSDEQSLILAKDFLLRCRFFGIAERMQESISRLSSILDIPVEHQFRKLNVNPSGSLAHTLSEQEWGALANVLRLDWALYEFALGLFDAQKTG